MFPVWRITDGLVVPVWLAVLSLSLSLSLVWVYRRSIQREVSTKDALDLSLALIVGAFFGARILHIIFEEPGIYFNDPMAAFRIWEGGMVFYGGLIGACVAAGILIFRRRLPLGKWADFFAPVAAANYGIGRIACFLNGCCYGKVCTLPWAVQFPSHAHLGLEILPRHPTQLYAAVWEFLLLTVLIKLERTRVLRTGELALVWLAGHSVGRLVMEHFRDDDRGAFIGSFSLSTWISAGLFLSSAIFLILKRRTSIPV